MNVKHEGHYFNADVLSPRYLPLLATSTLFSPPGISSCSICFFSRTLLVANHLPIYIRDFWTLKSPGYSLNSESHVRICKPLHLNWVLSSVYCWLGVVLVTESCLTLCNPLDCIPPDSSVHGILQARILEWVATSSSRGSSQPRDRTPGSCITGRFFTIWPPRKLGCVTTGSARMLI